MSKKLNIGYFADGPWSHKAFNKLIDDNEISISFVCVRFDTQDSTLKQYCKKYKIDYLKDKNINSTEFIDKISKYHCNLFISMSFNQIFKNEIINLPKLKTINCHAGKLPLYRGRNVLNWALINDEKEFGITIHFVDEGVDTGDIILQEEFEINDSDDYSTLLQTAHVECANVLHKAIKLFKNKNIKRVSQSNIHPTGFYCTERRWGDEILNWSMTSREIFNFIRAICDPAPMARSYINKKEIRINKSEMVNYAPNYKCTEGVILGKDSTGVYVKTGDNFIKITEYEYDDILKIGDRLEIE